MQFWTDFCPPCCLFWTAAVQSASYMRDLRNFYYPNLNSMCLLLYWLCFSCPNLWQFSSMSNKTLSLCHTCPTFPFRWQHHIWLCDHQQWRSPLNFLSPVLHTPCWVGETLQLIQHQLTNSCEVVLVCSSPEDVLLQSHLIMLWLQSNQDDPLGFN